MARTLRKRLACLNYRCAEEITMPVTRKLVRAYTPRVKVALKAVDTAMRAGELLLAEIDALNRMARGEECPPDALLYYKVRRAVQAEFNALDGRMSYLFDVVRADLGPGVARELEKEFACGGFVVQ